MNAHSAAEPVVPNSRASANQLLWPYAISLLIWGFDFRAQRGHSAVAFQAVLLLIYVGCFLKIAFAAGKRGAGVGPLWVLILVTALFMIESSTVGLIEGQRGYAIFTNLIPLFLYLSVGSTTYLVLSICKDDTEPFLGILRLACLVSGVAHLLVIFLSRGRIDVASSRYEVLSGAVVPSLGIIAVGITQKLSRLDISVVLLSLSIALLSVTRTLVVVLAVQVALVMVARPSALFRPATRKRIALIFLLGLSVIALDLAAGTGLTARWTDRLTVSDKLGTDPSALLRVAETRFMWNRFTSSLDRTLFGNGLAAVTSAIGREDVRVAGLVGRESAEIHSIGIGHENYASILYVAGLLGGGGLLILQFLNGIQSFALVRHLQVGHSPYRQSDAHVGIWGGVIVIGMLTVGFGSGTFGDRDTTLWFGVGTGMLYWAREMRRAARSGAGSRARKRAMLTVDPASSAGVPL